MHCICFEPCILLTYTLRPLQYRLDCPCQGHDCMCLFFKKICIIYRESIQLRECWLICQDRYMTRSFPKINHTHICQIGNPFVHLPSSSWLRLPHQATRMWCLACLICWWLLTPFSISLNILAMTHSTVWPLNTQTHFKLHRHAFDFLCYI